MKLFIALIMIAFMAMSFTTPFSPPEKNRFESSFVQADAAFSATVDQFAVTAVVTPPVVFSKYEYDVTFCRPGLVTLYPENYTLICPLLATGTTEVTVTVETNRSLTENVAANKNKPILFLCNGLKHARPFMLQINNIHKSRRA